MQEKLLATVKSLYPFTIELPIGGKTIALQEGIVHLSPEFKIHNVLFIPELKCNLIYLAQLPRHSNCFVTFSYDVLYKAVP